MTVIEIIERFWPIIAFLLAQLGAAVIFMFKLHNAVQNTKTDLKRLAGVVADTREELVSLRRENLHAVEGMRKDIVELVRMAARLDGFVSSQNTGKFR